MHTLKVTSDNVHDVTDASLLLTGNEGEVYRDKGYPGAEKHEDAPD